MSSDARNSLTRWSSGLLLVLLLWLCLGFFSDWGMPHWMEPYFWALILIHFVWDIVRQARGSSRAGASD
ncbi:hypothetical protein OF829_05065 [Sphingomonas sp. LB-2]|uniref:hypothetical protein n=1 Tax=Sphingomonas caeni TaxID=2984949 RepID=UPI00222F6732|nr:hypothetical protein [Sphingomonas caeni]MCW3846599.1 hypothetical protein [Sphingomonas caeni]